MNPVREPSASTQRGCSLYGYPLFSSDSVLASHRLRRTNRVRGVSYAGA